MAKRLFDVILSALGLLVAAPVLAAAALLIKLDSRGPVFYAGERVGKDGVIFRMYKLRTMRVGADRQGLAVTHGRDPRVTRAGRLLRQWKIDELPQLINVLRGEMSLVGPRPESPCYVSYYTPEQKRVLAVRPGITGLTQVQYRHEEALLERSTDVQTDYVEKIMPQKLSLDLAYLQNASLLGDIKLIGQTVTSLFRRAGPAGAGPLCQIGTFDGMSEGTDTVPPASPARRLKLALRRRLSPRSERRLKAVTNDLANRAGRVLGREERPAVTTFTAPPLQAGERVRVRSQAEIEATLNHWRQLRGCSFMPEMAQYCGTEQRVLKRLERFVDERDLRVKKARGIVFLEEVQCQGTADFGRCDRSCYLFWREEWLERITE